MSDSCQKGEGPREFWIPKDYECDFHSGIHVIEHSAYVQLEEKLWIVVEALCKIQRWEVSEHRSAKIAIEALSKINGAEK